MRFVSTLILVVLTAGVIAAYSFRDKLAPKFGLARPDATVIVRELRDVTPETLVRIEIEPDVQLERHGSSWTLPGEWPARQAEVVRLIETLCGLTSRFAPVPLDDAKSLGLDKSQFPTVVKLSLRGDNGEITHTLTFGTPPDWNENPFTRPTYLRIDDRSEALRLGPGLIDQLRKHRDDFLRRQLFPDIVRVKFPAPPSMGGESELPPPAVGLLDAQEVTVLGPDGTFMLRRKPDAPLATAPSTAPVPVAPEKLAAGWELAAPLSDRPDPDKLRGVLAAVPELWAEQFVSETELAKTGLDKPERSVRVQTRHGELTVLIGKVSRVKETKQPPPPPANPFQPPPPPPPPLREEYRYAKLPTNPQIFEVRTDRFGDLFVKPAEVRDPKLARFKSADVQKFDLARPDRTLSFSKQKAPSGEESWKITTPIAAPAEAAKITELLDKFSELQARGEDVIDSPDLKPFGLANDDKVATATLAITEEDAGATPEAPKKTTNRIVAFRIGKDDPTKKKLYIQASGSPRINAVGDDLLKLVDRPVLAYRSRRVIDLPATQVAKIAIERATDPYTLSHVQENWSLDSPVAAKADSGKALALAGDLTRLEATEFVSVAPTPEELKTFGLDAPAVKATSTFADPTTPAKTLLVGKPREGTSETFAKLADGPEVFAIKQQLKDTIDQPSLAYRPVQLWQASGPAVTQISIERPGESYTLTRDGAQWKIAGPFAANAFMLAVQPLLEAAAAPRAEKFEAHSDSELVKFGLDKPALTLRVTIKGDRPQDSSEKVLQLGKDRFAHVVGQPGVVVLPETTASAINRPALELLDRRLLDVDPHMIVKLAGTGPGGPWSATREGDKWTVDSLTPPAAGDRPVLDDITMKWAGLKAVHFAGYGSTDLKKFGLEPPASTITATVQAGDTPVTHTIALGAPVDGAPNARYARIDNGPAIAELSLNVVRDFPQSALEIVDRTVLSFDSGTLTALRRISSGPELAIERKDGAWKINKPFMAEADSFGLFEVVEPLANLRAVKVAAIGVTDLKPFGLDAPSATWEMSLTPKEGQSQKLTLKLGNATAEGRFASVGTDRVYILAKDLAAKLLAEPIRFRDRSLVTFTEANRVTISRSGRLTTFTRGEAGWRMTAPVAADAESFDLDDLVLAASKLRVDELVTEKLEKPEAELRFVQGDKEVAHILVGPRSDDGRALVKAEGSDLVGRLDAKLTSRMLAEYRKRSLWANLDAAQVESLTISPAGSAPVTVVKGETGWVDSKSGQHVRAEVVSEFLATLAGLRADHYAADEKADLKLYGLDPPQRTIVVRTRTGQVVTLNLGRFEGESKRPYASTPEQSGVVVVLSEADGAKLLKGLSESGSKQ
ncbi:MAG: DUF4340 domain-containing protein [Gemmataceae bacterium]